MPHARRCALSFCGQCHVEYYFRGTEKRLTYPWSKGIAADSMLAYYEENGHTDWIHAESGAFRALPCGRRGVLDAQGTSGTPR